MLKDIFQKHENAAQVICTDLSSLYIFEVFLPDYLLAMILSTINRILCARTQTFTTVLEYKGVLALNVLAASYSITEQKMTLHKNERFYFQLGIAGHRYSEMWSAMSCTVERIQRYKWRGKGWFNFSQRCNELIAELEDELAAVNQMFGYVLGSTIFSVDEDLPRLVSRFIDQLSVMAHINNPKKTPGPGNNALCFALNPLFLASHYCSPSDRVTEI